VLGLHADRHGAEIRDRVGYMPEQEAFLAGMSAVELCTYAGELSGLPRTEAMQRAHAALYYAGLEEKRYQPIDGYSTGMKQRVKLAQALVHDPEILFLDEPTNGLDPRSRDDMLELIQDLPARRNCAIVLSTHLLPDVERVCDHAVIMHHGRVRFVGSIDELRGARGRDAELAIEVKADAARLAEALAAAGVTCDVVSPVLVHVNLPADATTRLVFQHAHELGLQVRGVAARRETVEAAFLRVIGEAAP
jgi:ABC-2 type transport system ATP-binding protein